MEKTAKLFSIEISPDRDEFLGCLKRTGSPERVHFIELNIDESVVKALCGRFGLECELGRGESFFTEKRQIVLQRFLGYDYVMCEPEAHVLPVGDEIPAIGPVSSREHFDSFPWPDTSNISTRALEWYEENLPEDMCVITRCGGFAEDLPRLMGFEGLAIALKEQPELVGDICCKLLQFRGAVVRAALQFSRVCAVWASDDMGFRTGTFMSPTDLRAYVLPAHRELARFAHEAGRLYLLHACGRLGPIMEDLIVDVKIDAKHSFEDTIEMVTDAKEKYGKRIALLGGIDIDFLARADEKAVRKRVRATLNKCMHGGGYCLGTGNNVVSYIPIENYLAMLDEGRKF